jgi:arylsulfatase A-like enzyme
VHSLPAHSIAQPEVMDQYVTDWFNALIDEHLLDNTIVIVWSDHGLRFGDFR